MKFFNPEVEVSSVGAPTNDTFPLCITISGVPTKHVADRIVEIFTKEIDEVSRAEFTFEEGDDLVITTSIKHPFLNGARTIACGFFNSQLQQTLQTQSVD